MIWRDCIVAARERGYFTAEEKEQAGGWDTCAVGEQRAQHPLVVTYRFDALSRAGWPADHDLYMLGGVKGGFFSAVLTDNIALAERRLDEIEDRVLELKRARGSRRRR